MFRRKKNDGRQFSDSPDLGAASTLLAAPEEWQDTKLRLLATTASTSDGDLLPSVIHFDDPIDEDDDELQLVNPATPDAIDDSLDEQLPFHYYDGEDDLGDFDDLSFIEVEDTPRPARPASPPPPARSPAIASPNPTALAAVVDAAQEIARPVSRAPLDAKAEISTSEKAAPALAPPETSKPERSAPDIDRRQASIESRPALGGNAAETPAERVDRSAAREEGLEEASFGRVESTLALQPIPELQGVPSLRSDDSADDLALDLDEALIEDLDSEAVDLTDAVLETQVAETPPPDPGPIDLDEPESDEAESEAIDDDWHARLAELLIADDQEEKSESHSRPPDRAAKVDDQERNDVSTSSLLFRSTSVEQEGSRAAETAKPVLSLAGTSRVTDASAPDGKTEADEAYDEDDEPIPPALLARPAVDNRRPIPSASPGAADSLTPEQLKMAIIAMVPRLRRFAAALIGDERQADDLVQVTIDGLLAAPESLGAAPDINLAILKSLYGKRQEMARQGRSETGATSSARSFETMLCGRLAGADQFETTEFARAIHDLDEKGRAPLLLVALESLSYRDVAGVMNMAPDRIMDCVAQSRVRLRQMLSDGDVSMMEGSLVHEHMHEMETEINGYLDGELDETSMAGVDTLIEHDEDAADRLLQYGIQGDLIRRLYAPLLNRPIPITMLQSISSAVRRSSRLGFGFGFSRKKPLIAGMILLLAAGLAFSWPYLTSSIGSLVPEALAISSKIDIG